MNEQQARELVEKTFEADFDRQRFGEFISQLLKTGDFNKQFRQSGTLVREAFRDKVSGFERLAQFTDIDGKKIDVLIVNLKKDSTLERARTSLRNFAADYLQSDRGANKAAVLVAYVSNSKTDWRFSYVTLETELKQNEKGKFKEETTNLTPARRYSFLVGKAEDSHTAQKQFLDLIAASQKPTLKQIEIAFTIEKVTKEFFARYKELFEKLRDELAEICRKDQVVCREFINKGMYAFGKDDKGQDKLDGNGNKIKEPYTDDFAKKLLGQIVFLYFLQKKGWFGVEQGNDWGSGDKHFLRNLFDRKTPAQNYFNDVLEYLFYDALAVNRKGNSDFYGKLNCKIPFLNGGLFEATYDWINTTINLPDALFSNQDITREGDKGTGILDVFDRYNFTINEAEPLEVEVAVDPEMLGKIFENLLPENIRHGSGTYYTPRVIVAYMCQQSLINYLATHLDTIPREDIEIFMRFGSLQRHYTEAGTQSQADKFLPQSIIDNSRTIDELLQRITVCDPAIGSGAFPVGMMQEIVKAREALQAVAGIPQLSQYELKRQTIEHSLYGVDIDSGAVEIAKLRLWLSLIVDEDDYQNIEPLPNLDYKIIQGNSLLDEFHGVKLIDVELFKQKLFDKAVRMKEVQEEINRLQNDLGKANVGKQSSLYVLTERRIAELQKEKAFLADHSTDSQVGLFVQEDETQKKLNLLKQKHQQVFHETDKLKKEKLRAEAEQLEWQFIEAKLKADGKEGELAKLEIERKERRKNYFLWQLNFPEIFENNGGFDVVIANPPYISALEFASRYSAQDRQALNRNFQTAKGAYDLYVLFYEQGIRILKKNGFLAFINPNKFLSAKYAVALREFILGNAIFQSLVDVSGVQVFKEASVYPVMVFLKVGSSSNYRIGVTLPKIREMEIFNLANFIFTEIENTLLQILPENIWGFLLSDKMSLLTKLLKESKPLSEVGNVNATSTASEADEYGAYITEKNSSRSLKIINTGTIDRYMSLWGIEPMTHARKRFLKPYLPLGGVSQRRKEMYSSPKIIFAKMAKVCEAFLDTNGEVASINTNCFYAPQEGIDIRYVTAFCNSKIFSFLYEQFFGALRMSGGYFQFQAPQLRVIPIKEISLDKQKQITELVDQILSLKRENPAANTEKLEREIDRLVYQLYDLTDDEIAVIEGK